MWFDLLFIPKLWQTNSKNRRNRPKSRKEPKNSGPKLYSGSFLGTSYFQSESNSLTKAWSSWESSQQKTCSSTKNTLECSLPLLSCILFWVCAPGCWNCSMGLRLTRDWYRRESITSSGLGCLVSFLSIPLASGRDGLLNIRLFSLWLFIIWAQLFWTLQWTASPFNKRERIQKWDNRFLRATTSLGLYLERSMVALFLFLLRIHLSVSKLEESIL